MLKTTLLLTVISLPLFGEPYHWDDTTSASSLCLDEEEACAKRNHYRLHDERLHPQNPVDDDAEWPGKREDFFDQFAR